MLALENAAQNKCTYRTTSSLRRSSPSSGLNGIIGFLENKSIGCRPSSPQFDPNFHPVPCESLGGLCLPPPKNAGVRVGGVVDNRIDCIPVFVPGVVDHRIDCMLVNVPTFVLQFEAEQH